MSFLAAITSWIGLSLGSAVTAAVMPVMHEKIRADRLSMMFWLRVFMLVLCLPVLFFVGWPGNPTFYIATFITAFIWAYADLSSFRATEEFGAGAITRMIPLNVLVTFFMWVGLNPDLLGEYIQNPVKGLGILASILGAVYFAMRIQRNPLSRESIRALGPVILMSGMGVVFAKVALDSTGLHSAVFGYMVVQAFFMILIFGALEAFWHPVPREVFAGSVAMQTGFIMGLTAIVHTALKAYGYILVENPAYVSAVVLTTPIWVMLYYRLAKKQSVGSFSAAIGVAGCIVALVCFAAL